MSTLQKLLDMGYTLDEIPDLDVLDIIPFEPKYPEDVYMSLLGQLVPRCHLNWVENINVPGSPYDKNNKIIYHTALHVSERLGVQYDFEDEVMEIREAYERNEEIVAYEMFKYGMKYQQMLDAKGKE